MARGKQKQQGSLQSHQNSKKRRKHNSNRHPQPSDNQVLAKSVSIETQLRIQREKAILQSNQVSASDNDCKVPTPPTVVKGFVYDKEKQRYFKSSDGNKSVNVVPGWLPKAFNKCNLSPPARVSDFSVVGTLRRQQLIGKSMNYSVVLARSIQLMATDTFPNTSVKSVDYHPTHGKLLTTESHLLFVRQEGRISHQGLYFQHSSSSLGDSFISAKWAPISDALVGAVACDSLRGVCKVVVLRPITDLDIGIQSEGEEWAHVVRRMESTTVFELAKSIMGMHWAHSHTGGLELIVCSEDALYRVSWPSHAVSVATSVPSPAVCWSSQLDAFPSSCCGVVGLRNGSILMTDSRMQSSSCVSRMPHCIDHMYSLRRRPQVLAQDVVGTLSIFDLRKTSSPAVSIVKQHKSAASVLIKGSLFWVSSDEEMVLTSGGLDQSQNQRGFHTRAIDVWSVRTSDQRYHQVPIRVQSDSHSTSSLSSSLRFAPNDDTGGGDGGDVCLWHGASVVLQSQDSAGLEAVHSTLLDVCCP